MHIKTVHEQIRHACAYEKCDKTFASNYYLQCHIQVVHENTPFWCDNENCGKGLLSQEALNAHYQRRDEEGVFKLWIQAMSSDKHTTADKPALAKILSGAISVCKTDFAQCCCYCSIKLAFTNECGLLSRDVGETPPVEQASKERLNSGKGYDVPENLQISCLPCNGVKGRASVEALRSFFVAVQEDAGCKERALTQHQVNRITFLHSIYCDKDKKKNYETAPLEGFLNIAKQAGGVCAITGISGRWDRRKLPAVLITSLSLVTIIYLVANVTYFAALPLDTIRNTHVIGLNVGYRAMGIGGSILLSILIAICAFGTVNALTFGNGALIASFAKDGIIFPKLLARAHPTRDTPIYALCLNAAFSLALVFAGNLDFLVGMYAFSSYFFFALTIAGLLVMRFTHRDMPRPFRVWWPVAVLFLATSIFIVAFPFVNAADFDDILPFIIAIVFMSVPLPVVWFNLRRQHAARQAVAVADVDGEKKQAEDEKA
ncbi:hypothetical protein HDU86_002069 [Geranomyces michiganensis]|nr:hypothetical protein HDU86_002069 [Geranomyces michiganensis]